MGLVDDLIAQFQAQQDRANIANEQRFKQGMELFDRIIAQQEAGGTFEKATEAALERGRVKSVAQGTQALVSSGLASTTQAAGLGKKFEEEVGTPARLQAADIREQRLTQALIGKAGFIERREDTGPDFATIAGLAKSIGAGQQVRRVSTFRGGGGDNTFATRQAYLSRKASADEAEARRREARDVARTAVQSTPEAIAARRRRSSAQSYAILTSQRQRAGNVLRTEAGL